MQVNLIDAAYGNINITESHFAQTERQQCAGFGFFRNLQIFAAILALLYLQRLLYIRGTHIDSSGAIFIGIHLFLPMTVAVVLPSFSSRFLYLHFRLDGVASLLLALVPFLSVITTVVVIAAIRDRVRFSSRVLGLLLFRIRSFGARTHVTLQQVVMIQSRIKHLHNVILDRVLFGLLTVAHFHAFRFLRYQKCALPRLH